MAQDIKQVTRNTHGGFWWRKGDRIVWQGDELALLMEVDDGLFVTWGTPYECDAVRRRINAKHRGKPNRWHLVTLHTTWGDAWLKRINNLLNNPGSAVVFMDAFMKEFHVDKT